MELETAQQKLIDAADEEKTIAEERLRSSYTERKSRQHRESEDEMSPRGNIIKLNQNCVKVIKIKLNLND